MLLSAVNEHEISGGHKIAKNVLGKSVHSKMEYTCSLLFWLLMKEIVNDFNMSDTFQVPAVIDSSRTSVFITDRKTVMKIIHLLFNSNF